MKEILQRIFLKIVVIAALLSFFIMSYFYLLGVTWTCTINFYLLVSCYPIYILCIFKYHIRYIFFSGILVSASLLFIISAPCHYKDWLNLLTGLDIKIFPFIIFKDEGLSGVLIFLVQSFLIVYGSYIGIKKQLENRD